MNKTTFFIIVLCALSIISLAVNGFLVYNIFTNSQFKQEPQINRQVLSFRDMFTEQVLLSSKEIDFDNRIALETAVRNLHDSKIFAQWQKFTNCQTKEDATAEAKNLLGLLVEKTTTTH